jgi:hypothetical protein
MYAPPVLSSLVIVYASFVQIAAREEKEEKKNKKWAEPEVTWLQSTLLSQVYRRFAWIADRVGPLRWL